MNLCSNILKEKNNTQWDFNLDWNVSQTWQLISTLMYRDVIIDEAKLLPSMVD